MHRPRTLGRKNMTDSLLILVLIALAGLGLLVLYLILSGRVRVARVYHPLTVHPPGLAISWA